MKKAFGGHPGLWLVFLSLAFAFAVVMPALRAQEEPETFRDEVNPAYNFRISLPEKSWEILKTEGPQAFSARRKTRDLYLSIIAERALPADVDKDILARLVRTNMTGDFRVMKETPMPVGNINGVCFEIMRKTKKDERVFQLHWVGSCNGFIYQLLAAGSANSMDFVRREGRRAFNWFAPLDEKRTGPVQTSALIRTFESRYAYRVDLKGDDWFQGEGRSWSAPEAEYRAYTKFQGGFLVLPISLLGQDVDTTVLYRSLLSWMGAQLPKSTNGYTQIQKGDLVGISLKRDLPDKSSPGTQLVRVLRGRKFAYLLASWVRTGSPNQDQLLEDWLAQVTFTPEAQATPPPVKDFSVLEKRAHGLVFNDLGFYYWMGADYAKAADCMKVAFETKKDVPFLSNYVQAEVRAGRPWDALNYLNGYAQWLSEDPTYRVARGYAKSHAGQTTEGLVDYTRAFQTGFEDDFYFADYVRLLVDGGRMDWATNKLARYAKDHDTTEIHMAQAYVLQKQKDFDRATAILMAERVKTPGRVDVALALSECLEDAGKPAEALKVCNQLLDQGRNAASVYYRKAEIELAMHSLDEAGKSAEIALRKNPTHTGIQTLVARIRRLNQAAP